MKILALGSATKEAATAPLLKDKLKAEVSARIAFFITATLFNISNPG
jgi:hypothetical protein|tara:strand:+ start:9287 stop:9427 length:141 start_codon:yes stop_codon:yes gene_type:complete